MQFNLAQVRMLALKADSSGAVTPDTEMVFEQSGALISARYRGGAIINGYLIGLLDGAELAFRYVQADTDGRLDAGVSRGVLTRTPEGRLRLTEHFQWLTRPEAGVNVFEEPEAASGPHDLAGSMEVQAGRGGA